MNVSFEEVLRVAARRRASLAGESVGYLVLAVTDQLVGAPRRVDPVDVLLLEDGSIRLRGGQSSDAKSAERSVRQLLGALLQVASSSSPGLYRTALRASEGDLGLLVRELEAGLIPVNRAASKRSLSRLYRETREAVELGFAEPEEAPAEEVDVTLGVMEQSLPATPDPPRAVATEESEPASPSWSLPPIPELVLQPATESEAVEFEVRELEPEPEEILEVDIEELAPEPALDATPLFGTQVAPLSLLAPSGEPALQASPESDAVEPLPSPSLPVSNAGLAVAPVWSALSSGREHPEREAALSAARASGEGPTNERRAEPSDISELLAKFRVENARTERQVSQDLRRLAGVELTPGSPEVQSLTPPPVEASPEVMKPAAAPRKSRLVPSLIIAVSSFVGVMAWGPRKVVDSGSTPVAASRAQAVLTGSRSAPPAPEPARACEASVTVLSIPAGGRATLRSPASEQDPIEPEQAPGPSATFLGLPCERPLELAVRIPKDKGFVWSSFPISAAELSPTAASPEAVHVTLSVPRERGVLAAAR